MKRPKAPMKLPAVEAYLRRMATGGDAFDRLLARLRAKDGPFIHEAPDPEPEAGVEAADA